MPASRNPSQYIARQEAAWRYSSEGQTLHWIADQLERDGLGKVSYVAVHKMLVKTRSAALEDLKDRVNIERAKQSAALGKLYEEAMTAWRLSSVDEDGKRIAGDARLLIAALQVLGSLERLWNLSTPSKGTDNSRNTTELERFLEAKRWANDHLPLMPQS